MKVFSTRKEISLYYESNGIPSPGFVPTMGALHDGHLSLVKEAAANCRPVGVSIFVNPTQFNDPGDLKKYPRTLDEDLRMLDMVMGPDDFVFTPSVEEIYPERDTRVFDFGNLGDVMEGLHRPGHFNGVAQVVSILFDIVKPSKAFFGQKDFQQLAIIRELARRYFPGIQIISCPIIRESDGLAMSSRNRRLLPEHRSKAGIIYETLKKASEMAHDKSIAELKTFVTRQIEQTPGFRIEYFEIADEMSLSPIYSKEEILENRHYYGCIALFAGEIRLIDNMEFTL